MGRHNMYIWVHIYIYYTIRVSRKQTHPQMNVSMTWIFSTCGQSPLARIMSSNNVITCHLRCWVHKSSSRTISFLAPEVWFFIAFHIPFLSARLSGFCALVKKGFPTMGCHNPQSLSINYEYIILILTNQPVYFYWLTSYTVGCPAE